MTSTDLARLICSSLHRHPNVQIDGLGVFAVDHSGTIRFHASAARVFIAYAVEDVWLAERLYFDLRARGFSPWMDRHMLLPGQNWPRRIEDAISNADFFVGCFSNNSVNKRGGFQAEVRYALDCARRFPLDEVYLIPARFDNCPIPPRIQRETQYVDLFPDWDRGVDRIVETIRRRRPRPVNQDR